MWKVLVWPSQSHDLNPMEQALHFLKRRLKSETAETNNWKWLQQRLAKASQRKKSNVCWCQWVTCSKQVLHARDMQLNTNYYTMLIYSKLICYNTCAEKALAIFHDELSQTNESTSSKYDFRFEDLITWTNFRYLKWSLKMLRNSGCFGFCRCVSITNQLAIACQASRSLSTVLWECLLLCLSHLTSALQVAWMFFCKPWWYMAKVPVLSLL